MDHSLEAHINLSRTDNLSHIGRVIRLQESDLQALILEVTLCLRQIQRSMVRGGVPLRI